MCMIKFFVFFCLKPNFLPCNSPKILTVLPSGKCVNDWKNLIQTIIIRLLFSFSFFLRGGGGGGQWGGGGGEVTQVYSAMFSYCRSASI